MSVMTIPSPTGSPQMVLYEFHNPTSISGDVDGYFCPGSKGRTHPHQNLIIKKLKSARETGELETEGENAKKPPFGRILNRTLTYRTIIQTISS